MNTFLSGLIGSVLELWCREFEELGVQIHFTPSLFFSSSPFFSIIFFPPLSTKFDIIVKNSLWPDNHAKCQNKIDIGLTFVRTLFLNYNPLCTCMTMTKLGGGGGGGERTRLHFAESANFFLMQFWRGCFF